MVIQKVMLKKEKHAALNMISTNQVKEKVNVTDRVLHLRDQDHKVTTFKKDTGSSNGKILKSTSPSDKKQISRRVTIV